MGNAVLLNIENGLARITLNRPERMNAFDAEAASEWAEATAEAVNNNAVRAILVRGEGRAFCAGGDVRAMAQMVDRDESMLKLAHKISEGMRNLVTSSIPVVAAAHGTTAGGGLGVLLSCDYAVVGESSKIGSLYAKVGLTPDLSVSALLGRAIGERRALQLTLQDTMLTAQEAKDWGLVAEVVADDDVLGRAEEVAAHWANNAAWAYGQAKRLVRSSYERTFEEQLIEEAKTIAIASVTPDANERISNFARK
ncbi:MAG TPA: enoyl-CoA hydratase/isomerase family protein [Microbacteriaceae bacterium]|nr:enoyl-CoA hydratase/isomerase family protein [Microbacteriaceae bacterium]